MSILLVRNWWVVTLRGSLTLLLGLAAFFWPGGIGPQALAVLVPVFGIFALLNGLFVLIISFLERGHYERWWFLEHWWLRLLEAGFSIAVGIIVFVWPAISIGAILYLLSIWAIITGLLELGATFWQLKMHRDQVLLIVGGMLSLIFGLILLFRSDAPPLAVLWLLGAFAVAFGVLVTMFSLRLRVEAQAEIPKYIMLRREADSQDASVEPSE